METTTSSLVLKDVIESTGALRQSKWRQTFHGYKIKTVQLIETDNQFHLYVFTLSGTLRYSARFDSLTPVEIIAASVNAALLAEGL